MRELVIERRERTFGSSDFIKIIETYDEWGARFWPKINRGRQCWEWQAGTNDAGYGVFGVYKREDHHKAMKLEYAHRLMYMLLNGPVPEGHVVDHKCFNRKCCDPEHLQVIPHGINCAQGAKEVPQCGVCGGLKHRAPAGNLVCLPCHRVNVKRYKQRKKLRHAGEVV